MENSLIKIYESMIREPKEEVEISRGFDGKPVIYGSILTPQDSVNQAGMGHNLFKADDEGMKQFISAFQVVLQQYPQIPLRFPIVLPEIFYATRLFFGGDDNHDQRKSLYKCIRDDEGMIIGTEAKLCDYIGKGCAECIEKAVVTHNLLMILSRMGILKQGKDGAVQVFQPFIVFSEVEGEPHAFNMLRDSEKKKTYFVDNNYWAYDTQGKPICAIYSVTEAEYQKFMEGKKISPRLITPGTNGANNKKAVYGVLDDEQPDPYL